MGSWARRVRRNTAERALTPAGGRINAYGCAECGGYTVTLDVHSGSTPSKLACRATDGCKGVATSLGYPWPWPRDVPATPRWEWYRPQGDAERAALADPKTAAHLRAGGLLLRPRRHLR